MCSFFILIRAKVNYSYIKIDYKYNNKYFNIMSVNKKVCINCPKMFYTGNEQSPLHFGLSAEGYDTNSSMEGYDKNLWIVEIKNNKKVWIRKDSIVRITKEEPLINDVDETPSNNEIKEKNANSPTDYNIYIKYRLFILKSQSNNKTNKSNFDLVRLEWQELKKDSKKQKDVMVEAKKWFEETKDSLPKKIRQKQVKID